MQILAFLLVCVAGVSAQEAPKTGAVEGMVVNSLTGTGIEGVTVTISHAQPGQRTRQYETSTDAKGNFRFDAVDPGDYRPAVRKDRYVSAQGNFFGGGSSIQVRPADAVETRFELMPPGSIRGRVIGLDGNPAANVKVTLNLFSFATTGDDGVFVFENVPAGQYSLVAQGEPVPTFFPAAIDPALAQPIRLAPGADQSGYEIRLQNAIIHRVRGVVLDDSGKPMRKAMISLSRPLLDSEAFRFILSAAGATVFSIAPRSAAPPAALQDPVVAGEDGSFELPAVREGDWVLRAEAQDMHQSVTISVRQDIDDFKIRLEPEFTIRGRVTLSDGSAAPGNPMVMVHVVSADASPNPFGNSMSNKDGIVSLGSLTAGRYRVHATAINGNYYVTSVRAGATDVTDQPVMLSPATEEIRFVVKTGGTIRGTVEKCNGGNVLLVPQSLTAGALGRLHSCDPSGTFEFSGLPAGDYYAAAVTEFDIQTTLNEDRLGEIMRNAASVHLDDGATASVQLKLQ